jgi:putative phosphoesterase
MAVAVLADIHGNIVALEAVLKDLEHRENVDHIVVAGDLFTFGPAPNEVLVRLQALSHACFLLGNTDRYLLDGTYPSSHGNGDWQDKLLFSFHWTAERLEGEGFHFLEALPAFQLVEEGRYHLLVVHGSPRCDEEGLSVATEASDFEDMHIEPEVAVLVCGHTHVPMDRSLGELRVVNAGTVGLPFDGDPRACYAVVSSLTDNGEDSLQVGLRRVSYDVEKAGEQFFTRDHPAADIGAYNLRTARSKGTTLIYTPEMRNHNRSSGVDDQ